MLKAQSATPIEPEQHNFTHLRRITHAPTASKERKEGPRSKREHGRASSYHAEVTSKQDFSLHTSLSRVVCAHPQTESGPHARSPPPHPRLLCLSPALAAHFLTFTSSLSTLDASGRLVHCSPRRSSSPPLLLLVNVRLETPIISLKPSRHYVYVPARRRRVTRVHSSVFPSSSRVEPSREADPVHVVAR